MSAETKEIQNWTKPLKGKKVYVRPILRQHGMISDPDHEAYFLFGQSTKEYSLPIGFNGKLVYPFSCDEERQWLERELRQDLNPFLEKNNYWAEKYVVLGKDEKVLDLSDPTDYTSWLILRHNKDFIAQSGDQKMKKKTYRYSLEEENFDLSYKAQKNNLKAEAFAEYFKIKDNKTVLIEYLRIIGIKVNEDTLIEFAQNKMTEYLDKNPAAFISLTKDNTKPIKLFIQDLVENGLIKKKGSKYYFIEGEPICDIDKSPVIDSVVEYFLDVKNQEIKDHLTLKLKQVK